MDKTMDKTKLVDARTLHEDQGQLKIQGTWKDFFKLFVKIPIPWHLYIPIFIVSLIINYFVVDLPIRLSGILDELAMGGYNGQMVLNYILLSLGIMLAQNVTAFLYVIADNLTIRNARKKSWTVLLGAKPDLYKAEEPLTLISRVTNDPRFVATIIKETFLLLSTTYTVLLTFYRMSQMSKPLTLAIAAVIPYMIIVGLISGHFLENTLSKVQLALAKVTAFFAERYNKLKLVRVFGKERWEDEKTREFTLSQFVAKVKRWLVELIADPFRRSCQALLVGVTLIYGGALIGGGALTAAMLFAFYQYASSMNNHLNRYVSYYQTLKLVKGSTGKLANLYAAEPERLKRELAPADVLREGQALELNGVFFAYNERLILRDVSVKLPIGKVTAIVGPSGAGKTTLFNVLERLYSVKSGELAVDGVNLERVHLDAWRRSIGLVSQRPVLFSGTLRENLCYGLGDDPAAVSEAKIAEALEAAQLTDFVKSLPEGLDTQVGEFGSLLSGGQRQRVVIARLFLLDPAIVLLDEATSALDATTERQVQAALDRLQEGRTVVMIAHRLQTVRNAEQILLMKDGTIAASGRHAELYEKSPLYRELVDVELKKNEELGA